MKLIENRHQLSRMIVMLVYGVQSKISGVQSRAWSPQPMSASCPDTEALFMLLHVRSGTSSGLLLTSDSLICKSLHSWRNYRGLRTTRGSLNSDTDLLSCILDSAFPSLKGETELLCQELLLWPPSWWCPSLLWSALVPVKTLATVKDYSLFCTVSFLSPSFRKLKGIRLI